MKIRNRNLLSILLSLLVLTVSLPAVSHAQEAAAPAAAEKAPHKNKTLWTVLKEGGVMMIPIGLVSVGMCSLIALGFLTLRRRKLVPDDQVSTLRKLFTEGDYQAAVEYCRQNPGLFTDAVYTGLLCVGQGKEVTERAMEDTLAKGIAGLATRNYYLNLIGVITPMLGLTGTVLGMMGAFSTLGTSGIGDPSALAGAIGEVLVATASGLFIAIPAFTFYYVFRNWITAATAYAEDHINTLFRGMPYQDMDGIYFGTEPIFAAAPNWIGEQPAAAGGLPDAEPSVS
ncbi:MAG: MotA/TolQ/ExbB proton channel family protein [Terrimicrobiaceae bacterium]|nr:MotA/TolQ/ExbB proton channel family protein [Terrimicrobiaceae bacterium]